MYLSNYQFRLLKYVHRKPYLSYSDFVKKFCRKNTQIRLDNAIAKFRKDGLLEITHNTSSETDDGIRYDLMVKPTDATHLILSEYGQAIVQERLRNGRMFWIPWVITSILAVAQLIVSFASLTK